MPSREECIDEFARWLAGVLVAREADEAAALKRAATGDGERPRPVARKTLKRDRTKLAKAELWLLLGVACDGWARDLRLAGTGEGGSRRPSIDQWPANDPLCSLMERYDLSVEDLAKLLGTVGEECERRALRGGYDQAWIDGNPEQR